METILHKNIITIFAMICIMVVLVVATVAAVTGNYDSASVRAFIDDVKYLAAALGLGAGIGRGLIAAAKVNVPVKSTGTTFRR